ncbi:MAG: hypothetical protein EAZ97_02465 [Bacteroidetes bacterium]|nr:MAG: hypothetical protein EAZ97_02465 [Bacteroidota bacterium]
MKILIKTEVKQDYAQVFSGFNESLFSALAPPFPFLKVLRFDGCKKDDQVQIELDFVIFRQKWFALIVDFYQNSEEICFVDQGTVLPFFVKSWKHYHRILKTDLGSVVVDEIEFKTPFLLTDYLLYPLMYLQFLYRKPIYKRIFGG